MRQDWDNMDICRISVYIRYCVIFFQNTGHTFAEVKK